MPVVRSSIIAQFVVANQVKPVTRSVVVNSYHQSQKYNVNNLEIRVDHRIHVDRTLCAGRMETFHHANVFKDILVLHHIVDPSVSLTQIARPDWPVSITNAWTHVLDLVVRMQNAVLPDTPYRACVHKDMQAIRLCSACRKR